MLQRKLQELIENLRYYANEDKHTATSATLDKIKHYFETATKPGFTKRYVDPSAAVMKDVINLTMHEISSDLKIGYLELHSLSESIIQNFNHIQTSNMSLQNELGELDSLISDYRLLVNQPHKDIIYINDGFNTMDNVDEEFGSGTRAHISTDEGIVSLRIVDSKNQSLGASIDHTSGNGELGNHRIVNPDVLVDDTNILTKGMFFLSYENTHDDLRAILDGQPNTWVEYQMLNIPTSKKEEYHHYDFTWARGRQTGDKLRLRLVIKFPEVKEINWININPYLPFKHNASKVTVYSISTSENGTEYVPIYDSHTVLNTRLNILPDTYRPKSISDENFALSKFASQGVWNFPARRAQYVEVVLDQDESHPEIIGLTYYHRVSYRRDNEGRITEIITRIPEHEVEERIREGTPGTYPIATDTYITKGIEPTNGWRYTVGVRGINIYSHKFSEEAEVISRAYTLPKTIRAVSLDVNEKIPPKILSLISQRNEWIKYYFTLNDIDWYPISPTYHRQVGEEKIPPKIYIVNTSITPTIETNRRYIYLDEDPKTIRFKAVLSRPTDMPNASAYSPILEDYTIKIVTEE